MCRSTRLPRRLPRPSRTASVKPETRAGFPLRAAPSSRSGRGVLVDGYGTDGSTFSGINLGPFTASCGTESQFVNTRSAILKGHVDLVYSFDAWNLSFLTVSEFSDLNNIEFLSQYTRFKPGIFWSDLKHFGNHEYVGQPPLEAEDRADLTESRLDAAVKLTVKLSLRSLRAKRPWTSSTPPTPGFSPCWFGRLSHQRLSTEHPRPWDRRFHREAQRVDRWW